MRCTGSRLFALFVALALTAGYAGADELILPTSTKSSLRFNPIVRAVLKTKASVVTIRVPRPRGAKDLIGTGVIIHDECGLIVTNNHVVAKKSSVNVRLHDGTELVGEVLVNEPSWDLAVVKIKTDKKLQALPLASVADLMVGEEVIAVGHPYGYQNSVSRGIVSAVGREITMPTGETINGLIQTDASINPGNSGGPLLNIEGDLIGINVAIREGAQGIAFAINAGTVRTVLSKYMSSQRVNGVSIALIEGDRVAAITPSTTGAGVGVSTDSSR